MDTHQLIDSRGFTIYSRQRTKIYNMVYRDDSSLVSRTTKDLNNNGHTESVLDTSYDYNYAGKKNFTLIPVSAY